MRRILIGLVTSALTFVSHAMTVSENEVAYVLDKDFPQAKPYRQCFIDSARALDVPIWLLLAVGRHENGPGQLVTSLNNPNGSTDFSLMGINTLRLIDLKNEGITWNGQEITGEMLYRNPCLAIKISAYLLRGEYEAIKGSSVSDWMKAVGNYHYDARGDYPKHHYKYRRHITDTLTRFNKLLAKKKSNTS